LEAITLNESLEELLQNEDFVEELLDQENTEDARQFLDAYRVELKIEEVEQLLTSIKNLRH
jgi:hypothetical protein